MRTVIRTMLAAAAGAALVASGTTVVRLSTPAFADTSPVAAELTPRPGLVPDPVAADAPAGPETAAPEVPQLSAPTSPAPTVVEQEQEQARAEPIRRSEPEQAEPIRRSEPEPEIPSTPTTDEPAATTDEPAAAPAEPPTIAPVADPPVRRVPVERQVDVQEASDGRDDTVGTGSPVRDGDRPSLLGRLTDPLGVSCGGLLEPVCG